MNKRLVFLVSSARDYIMSEFNIRIESETADPSSRAVLGVGLRPLTCCDCGFESHPWHGCLSFVSVVCCQVQVSATD